jgi:diamine N-acetyltransferase
MLKGENVLLRALEPGDVDVLFEWENDTTVWDVSATLAPFSRFQVEQYVIGAQNDIYTNRQLRLMIDLTVPQADVVPIGTVDLFDFDPVHRRAGVGILVREPYRSKGYGAEAMKLFIRYAFDVLHLHQLYCNIMPANISSIKLFENLGFTNCGNKKEWLFDGQEWHDEWMFQLIRTDD